MSTLSDTGVTIDHQIGPRGRVTIRQTSGEISIRGVEGDRVRLAADDEKAFRNRFSVELGKDSLDVNQNEKLGFGIFGRGESVDLTIEAPHGATVMIETQSGDISASDLSGSKAFRTASGEVVLKRLAGPVEVETVSGDLEIEGQAPIDLKGRTVSGDVDIQVPVIRRLDLGTTSGDMGIDGDLRGEGPFALRTISGDVHFVVRSGVRVEAETITGDLSSDLDSRRESSLGRKVMVVGRPGATLSFRSVSGDFRAAKPRTAAPALKETPMTDSPAEQHAGAILTDAEPATVDADGRRLEILRKLERGEISVAEAGEQLGELVAQGKLTAEDAAPILEALERKPKARPGAPTPPEPPTPPRFADAEVGSATGATGQAPRFARVEVRERGRRVVDLRVPISLGRFALSRVPGLSSQQIAEVEDAVTSGAHGPILDVQDPDGDGVRIVLE